MEPISSSGLATKVTGRAPAGFLQGGQGVQAGQQPALHVAGARAPGRGSPLTWYGRAAQVPSSKTVSMCPISRRRGPSPARWPITRSPSCSSPGAGGVGDALDLGAKLGQRGGHPVGDAVDAGRGVGAAIDVDERLQLRQVPRQACLRRPRAGWAGAAWRVSILPAMPQAASADGVELLELRVLDGPNRFFTRPAVKLEFGADEPGVAAAVATRRRRKSFGTCTPAWT